MGRVSIKAIEKLVSDTLLPKWRKRLDHLDRIDGWLHKGHAKFPLHRRATSEQRSLQDLAEAPWGAVVVSTVAQSLDMESIYTPVADDPAVESLWGPWKRNRMDRMQGRLYRASIAFGEAYTRVTLDEMGRSVIDGRSARDVYALYEDSRDEAAEPRWLLEKVGQWDANDPAGTGLIDLWEEDGSIHRLGMEYGSVTYIEPRTPTFDPDGIPFVRYAPTLDLEGCSRGEIDPLIPLLGKIEKTSYDRLLIQHFNSWKVKTASGLDDLTTEENEALKMRLANDSILTGGTGVEFGSLDETSLAPMVAAHESDVEMLAALSQTPITALGKFVNVSADAIAEARAALYAKRDDYRKSLGISNLDTLRLAALAEGRYEDAANFDVYSGWADTEVRTMAAAADALGKVATMLNVPPQELWPMLPFVNYTMAERWKSAARRAQGASILDRLRAVSNGAEPEV